MNECKRAMIGNHGEELRKIRPTDRVGYSLFENWNNHAFRVFLVLDFEYWRREIVETEVKETKLDLCHVANRLRQINRSFTPADDTAIDLPVRKGIIWASWEADRYCRAVGVLVRVDAGDLGVHYCQAQFPYCNLRPAAPDAEPPRKKNDIMTVNYTLDSHTSAGTEYKDQDGYRPSDDFAFGFGNQYFD